jgi:hypothetical protein
MGEPFPIVIPGLERPLRSDKIKELFDEAFWFYQDFYEKCRHSGPPLSGPWTEWPQWIPQLQQEFNNATEQIRNYNIAKSYKV